MGKIHHPEFDAAAIHEESPAQPLPKDAVGRAEPTRLEFIASQSGEVGDPLERSGSPRVPSEESVETDDALRQYLNQMGAIPMLSREEEVRLTRKIDLARRRWTAALLECPAA